jgi:hypothetical protein
MKSWILIGSYLWKDTWSRWWEQPSTVLARIFVGVMLVSVATVILIAFTMLERGLKGRLEAFGLNTLIVRETVNPGDAVLALNTRSGDRFAMLEASGEETRLRQLYLRGRTEYGQDLLVMTYAPDASAFMGPWLTRDTPLVCLSDALPQGTLVKVTLGRQSGYAAVHSPGALPRSLGSPHILLAPQGWAMDTERLGYVDTVIFQRREDAWPMQRFVEAINALYVLDGKTPPQMQTPLALVRELENLQGRQKQWRQILAAILGATVALVFGAIAILEFRQNLYVGALLRSFGTPSSFLYFRQWLENAFLANLAAAAAIAVIYMLHTKIFGTLGFPRSTLSLAQHNPYLSKEILLVLLCVNVGAFLSSLPVALGLRKPVGEILN